ncbi:MAG: hypothetical protein HFE25_06045 [Clostridia bacterium]|jgi:hypothetical protein|nr:hypothetical protein [Clostridia bacterium]
MKEEKKELQGRTDELAAAREEKQQAEQREAIAEMSGCAAEENGEE